MRPASSTSHYSLHIHPQHTDLNSGATASASSTSFHIPTTTTTFSPKTPFKSTSTSTPLHHIVVATSMATSMSAPQPLAFHTENTTAEPSSSNSRTISQFQRNSPYAIGIPTTTFTTTPPFSSHPTTLTIRPGSKNTITLPTGCLHSTGPSSHTTSSLKPKVGNSPNIERIFTPDWPLTNVSFDDYDYANRPSENHTFTLPPNTTLSHFSATSPNTQQPLLKQPNNCGAVAALT